MDKKAVTIHEVAALAGVSSMTASRVVNRSGQVSDALRRKVEAAVQELNYVPNLAARAARSGLVKIGILFSNPRSSNLGEFLTGAFSAAAAASVQLMVEPLVAHATPLDALRKLIELGAQGVVLPPPLCDSVEALQLLRRHNCRSLSFATASPRLHTPAVMIDDFAGAVAMTEHLIALGHRRIAFLQGALSHSPARRRTEGFLAAMASAGLPVPDDLIAEGDFSYRSGLDAGERWLNTAPAHRPTAIFASNDDMATGMLAVAHGLRLRIPEDISIAGFDDTPFATAVWPQLTTIHQPLGQMAAEAVKTIACIVRQGGDAQTGEHRVIGFTVMKRGSTGPAT